MKGALFFHEDVNLLSLCSHSIPPHAPILKFALVVHEDDEEVSKCGGGNDPVAISLLSKG
jgi:hypothetical protein